MVASQEAARRAAGILTAQSRAALAHDFVDEFRAALRPTYARLEGTLPLKSALELQQQANCQRHNFGRPR